MAPARPNPLAAVAARPAEITICAEYLALTIARRRGWGTERAELLAELTGLPVRHLVGLLRGADHGAVAARGALLRGVTGTGGRPSMPTTRTPTTRAMLDAADMAEQAVREMGGAS